MTLEVKPWALLTNLADILDKFFNSAYKLMIKWCKKLIAELTKAKKTNYEMFIMMKITTIATAQSLHSMVLPIWSFRQQGSYWLQQD